MELAVEQHREEKHKFQNKMEHVLQENDRLLTQALSVDIVNVVVHANVMSDCLNVDVYAHCVTIESELKKDFIKKECYETLLQQYHTLEKHLPPREPIPIFNSMDKPVVTLVYTRKPKAANKKVPKKLEPNNSWGSSSFNVPSSLLTCRLSKSSSGSQGNNLYTLSLQDMMASSPICLLSKASKTKSWIWHRCLSHLNFGAINHLARHDNGTEFVNQTLRDYYEEVSISHETSVARSPQQNGVVLIEAARTMLIYAQAPLFLWAEVVATTCFTQNRSIIRLRHGKTPYELLHSKLPDLSFFHVFGTLCYPTNDSENLGKLQPKADIGIFIGYAPTKKAFRIYNRRTRRIVETIHVDFDELTTMASEHSSLRPALNDMTPGTIKPKTYKEALTQACWIKAMQEELNEFERLEV
nr:retrovirus-related Pol polyprotein from transposon TNT 1-94 [Tanacetum cinerariifolium]